MPPHEGTDKQEVDLHSVPAYTRGVTGSSGQGRHDVVWRAIEHDRTWREAYIGSGRAIRTLMLALALVLWLASCSSPPQSAPPLPALHLAHATRLPWLDSLIAQDATHQLRSLALYDDRVQTPSSTPGASSSASPSTHQVRMLALVDGQVVDVGLDGSEPHRVALVAPCVGGITVTTDGAQAACSTMQGVEVFSAHMDASAPNSYLVLPDAPNGSENFGDPSWSLDGRLLMVRHGPIGNREIEVGSRVGIYRLPTVGPPQLLLDLRFPQLAVDEMLWSPDDNWLIVEGSPDGEHFHLYAYWLAPWLPALRVATPNTLPLQVSVSNVQLSPMNTGADGPFTWHPEEAGQAVITFSVGLRQAVVERAVTSQAETTLFTQHVGLICGLAWVPEGAALVFQLCGPTGDNAPGPPAHLYVYQPPSGA